MSSFYGGASIYGGTGSPGGSANEGSLKKLVGTEENPIILNTIEAGTYMLTGYYKYITLDEEIEQIILTQISVTEDFITGNKIVTYEYLANGKPYLRVITYYDDGTYSIADICLANSSAPLIFIDDEEATAPAGSAPIIFID